MELALPVSYDPLYSFGLTLWNHIQLTDLVTLSYRLLLCLCGFQSSAHTRVAAAASADFT